MSEVKRLETDSLQKQLLTQSDDTNKVKTLIKLHMNYRIPHADSSLLYIKEAIKLSEELHYNSGIINARLKNGVVLYKLDRWKEALEEFEKIIPVAIEEKDYKRALSLYNNISVINSNMAVYNKALQANFAMLEMNEKYIHDTKYECNGHINLGIVYIKQKKYQDALNAFKIALPIAIDSAHWKLKRGTIYDRMGTCYFEEGLLDSAKYMFNKSIKERIKDGQETGQASTLINLAKVYLVEENYRFVKKNLDKAYELFRNQEAVVQMAKTKLIYGELYYAQKQYQKSITDAQEALMALRNQDAKGSLKEAYYLLARANSGIGNHKKAYQYQKKYDAVKDSIYNSDIAQQFAAMQTEFDLQNKEKAIALLNKDNELQAAQARTRMYVFSAVGILLLVIILIITNQYRVKKKSNELLQLQKEEILERNAEINQKNEEIMAQRDQLELLNEDMTASIRYAKRLQDAILPPDKFIKNTLANAFVLYKPKDIVSGDFYWVHKIQDYVMFAVVDCTGHGVPGAFMSIVGNDAINLAVADMDTPKASKILNYLNLEVTKRLHQGSEGDQVKDGMDLALCTINKETLELQFAGAYNPCYIIRNKELIEIKGDPFSIGMFVGEEVRPFTNQKFQLEKNDMVYVFSDGYADQFGGPRGKKFKYKPFKEMLIDISDQPAEEQKQILDTKIEEWRNFEGRPIEPQIDDICIMGIRV